MLVSDYQICISFKGLWMLIYLPNVVPAYQIHVKMMALVTMILLTSTDVPAHMVSRYVLGGEKRVEENVSFIVCPTHEKSLLALFHQSFLFYFIFYFVVLSAGPGL